MNEDNRPMPYSLRLEPDMRTRLEMLAKANGRSLNAQIVMILEAALTTECEVVTISSAMEKRIRELIREELAKAGKG